MSPMGRRRPDGSLLLGEEVLLLLFLCAFHFVEHAAELLEARDLFGLRMPAEEAGAHQLIVGRVGVDGTHAIGTGNSHVISFRECEWPRRPFVQGFAFPTFGSRPTT